MPLTIFNLSTVDRLYIGKDTVIAFAEQPVLKTYNIELASEDKIKEHLAKPQNWVPQRHETLPEIPHDTAFLCSPADVPGPRKVQLQDKDANSCFLQQLCKRLLCKQLLSSEVWFSPAPIYVKFFSLNCAWILVFQVMHCVIRWGML